MIGIFIRSDGDGDGGCCRRRPDALHKHTQLHRCEQSSVL